ncbi:T9SS type A sorting domain-containing protein [Aridibaculum aurantiacum]|uniref:T9SS type A sorting domain-containing protein n=1 Tax=Aridibaculum aurantiacum TaxID=2810307 RepID=UPI001A963DCB|nr:T9SS type A sorting domain-containing protein [Aridibaculum aurantiacum]
MYKSARLLTSKLGLLVSFSFLFFTFSCSDTKPHLGEHETKSEAEGLLHQEFYMTKDPALGYIPIERKFEGAQQTLQLLNTSRTNNFVWQERGPNNIAGRVRAVLIDRRDGSGNTIFAGGVSGGLWKCTNFKTNPTWALISDSLPNVAIGCIAQDPSNPNIMYAGTGEGWFNADAMRGNGILKTIDGGNTWFQLPSTRNSVSGNFDYVQDIEVTSTGVVYAATRSITFCNNGGVLRSVDGGNTWTRSIGTMASTCADAANYRGADLEVASNGDLYATTGFQSGSTINLGRIWKSPASLGAAQGTDGNWTEITPAGTWRRIEIAVAPSNPNVIYALLQAGSNNAIGGLRRSDDGGATWFTLPLPTWCDQGQTSTDFTRTQAWFDLIAQVDPNNPQVCYIGGVDILKTVDGGTSWQQITQWANGCSGLPNVHADQHEILFFGNSSTELLAANDGGIYYSSTAGQSWTSRNNNFNITQFYSIDHHPQQTNFLLGGTQDNGTLRFTLPSVNTVAEVFGGDGGFAHIDQTDGVLQVASATGNNYRVSRNSGASFNVVVQGGSSATGRFINPSDYDDENDILVAGHNANTMAVVTGIAGPGNPQVNQVAMPTLNGRQISAVKVDPNGGATGTVWIAGSTASNASAATSPNLIKLTAVQSLAPTVLHGQTFSAAFLPEGSYISCIDVETGNADHVVITISNYGVPSVLESLDGGATWANVEGNLPDVPVRWVLIAPNNAQLNGPSGGTGGLIVGTELGVWTTTQTNGPGTIWLPNNRLFPLTRVDMLKYRRLDNLLSAATHGRGLFTTNIPSIPTSVNTVANTKGFVDYVSANQQHLFIKTGTLTGVRNITINVLDAKGRLVMTERTNYAPKTLDIGKLAPGMYVVKIYGDKKETYTRQIVK